MNANYVMHACLTGIAMRKGGIRDSACLSPPAESSVEGGKAARRR